MEAVIGEYCVIPGKVPSQHGGVDEEPYWRRWDYTLFCHFPSYQVVVTQIRGHIAGSFPPLPTRVRALHFFREKRFQLFLRSSTRVESCLPTRGALSG